mgnify:CR=1 FL=1
MTYNGWTNYETWAVNLWLGNDEDTYRMVTGWADECRKAASQDRNVGSGIWTVEETARIRLADRLKDYIEEENPIGDQASVYVDLLNAAISEVNWQEIAEDFLKD